MTGNTSGVWTQGQDPGPLPDPFPDQSGIIGTARDGPGVVGTTSKNYGVFGQFRDAAGITPPAGVCGNSRQGFGVFGLSSQLMGVVGLANKFSGVWGASKESVGVGGGSDRSYGVVGVTFAPWDARHTKLADAPAGVYGLSTNGSNGVVGVADLFGAGIVGKGTRDAIAGFFEGDVTISANLHVAGQIFAGTKDAMVPFPDGSKRVLHCTSVLRTACDNIGRAA
jgi:hypothetical protein